MTSDNRKPTKKQMELLDLLVASSGGVSWREDGGVPVDRRLQRIAETCQEAGWITVSWELMGMIAALTPEGRAAYQRGKGVMP